MRNWAVFCWWMLWCIIWGLLLVAHSAHAATEYDADMLLEDFIDDFIADDFWDEEPASKKPRRTPQRWTRHEGKYTTTDVAEKILGGYYDWHDDLDDDVNLARQKEFRGRYRVPYSVYIDLLYECRLNGLGVSPNLRCGEGACIPLEVKVLTALRILGRGMTRYDDIDHTKMGPASIRVFFHDFCEMMSAKLREKWIYLPRNEAELRRWMEPYEAAGFPGCWGSADCVHVAWDRCPAGERHMYKRGDKETPTVVWNVISNNSRRVMSVSRAFPGTQCDKTISQNDESMLKLRSGVLYKGTKFKLHTTPCKSEDCDAPYIITDGGYHKWPMLICAFVFNFVVTSSSSS